MLRISLLCLFFLLSNAQQYPSCPGGAPLSVGNATDPYNLHVLQLSSFLILADSQLQQAFQHYLATGDDSQVEEIIARGRNFYIIITVVLSGVSVVLFVMLARMGDLKFSQKEQFEKLKQEGYSSPLSAFFTLLAVALLAFTSIAAYLIPSMIDSLKMTECRLDGLHNSFLHGASHYDWDGLEKYNAKLKLGSDIASTLTGVVSSPNFTLLNTLSEVSQIYISKASSAFSGIRADYSIAQITFNDQNSSQNIGLSALIHNFTSIFSGVESLITLLSSASSQYRRLQVMLNESMPVINQTQQSLLGSSGILRWLQQDFVNNFAQFRVRTAGYFRSGQFSLLVSQILVGLTVVGCLVSLVTIRLIQAQFDFFSLRVYRLIWASHILVFCLNLAALLVAAQTVTYAQGACLLAERVLNNRTVLAESVPDVNTQSGLGLLYSCMNQKDFTVNSNTEEQLRQVEGFLKAREDILELYGTDSVGNFHQVFQNFRLNISGYMTGVMGVYPYLNQQLAAINNILLSNPYRENCFKHHWQFHPSACSTTQDTILIPQRLFMAYQPMNTSSFAASPSICYILSNYDTPYPHFINISQFVTLYKPFLGRNCTQSLSALKTALVPFFGAQSTKENVLDSLTNQVLSLKGSLQNASYYLLQYLTQRTPLLSLLSTTSFNTLMKGNDCGIVGAMVEGVFNQFCVNYRAQGRQVYLIILCNLGYSVLLILLSFLYALELQGLNSPQDPQETQRVIFDKRSEIVESDGSVAELESTSSQKSAEPISPAS